MGRMKFGSSLSPSPLVKEDSFSADVGVEIEQPVYITVPPAPEYIEIEKIVYIDKPVEVIKEIEVIKYVDREVIKEVPVIVEKVVLVEAATPPPPEIKEVIVEKYIPVDRYIKVKNEINTILIYVIALSLLANIIQGMF